MRFVPNPAAMYELRRLPGVQAELEERAARVLDAAGGEQAGYALDSEQGAKRPQGRWRVTVYTKTPEAMRENAEENMLTRALGRARG